MWNACQLELQFSPGDTNEADTIQAGMAKQSGEQGIEVCETRWKDTWEKTKASRYVSRVHASGARNEEVRSRNHEARLNCPRTDIDALVASYFAS